MIQTLVIVLALDFVLMAKAAPKMSVYLGNMNFFNRKEISFIAIVLLVIFTISLFSYWASFRRERDFERSSDITNTKKAIMKFYNDFGFYPPSTDDGEILACVDEAKQADYYNITRVMKIDKMNGYHFLIENARACKWGVDPLLKITDTNYPAYITLIPTDPKIDKGRQYYYSSDGKSFEIYGSFEGSSLSAIDDVILEKKVMCGNEFCNFGFNSE